MGNPSFALIHGGSATARYWDRLVPLLRAPYLAIDLPGRGGRPADLNGISISDWVKSAVRDIEDADLEDIILVGNSLAGITMPGVAARLSHRMRHLVFSSCTVAPEGKRTVDMLRPDIQHVVTALEGRVTSGELRLDASSVGGFDFASDESAREVVGEDAPEDHIRFWNDPIRRQFPEAMAVFYETFSWAGFPAAVPRTYLKNTRDAMVPPELQDQMIEAMGGAHVIELDTPHCPSITHPELVAGILNSIADTIREQSA